MEYWCTWLDYFQFFFLKNAIQWNVLFEMHFHFLIHTVTTCHFCFFRKIKLITPFLSKPLFLSKIGLKTQKTDMYLMNDTQKLNKAQKYSIRRSK